MKKGGGERYSMEEALAAQQYATDKEGKGFSEKASETSYAEAERVIGLLRDKKFDWLGIDWKKVDFKNIGADAETRIRAGLETVLAAHKKKDAKKKPGAAAVRKFAPWTAVAAMLIAACAKEPRSPRQELFEAQREHMLSSTIGDQRHIVPTGAIEDLHELMEEAAVDSSIQIESYEEVGYSPRARAAIKDFKDRFERIRTLVVTGERIVSDGLSGTPRRYQLTVKVRSTEGLLYKKVVEYTVPQRPQEGHRVWLGLEEGRSKARDRSQDWDRETAATEAVINAISEIVSENNLNAPEGRAASGGL